MSTEPRPPASAAGNPDPHGGRRSVRAPVTVVIPAYNAAATLDRAIDSVERQTWIPAEILVVDDGSTDATLEVARARSVDVLSGVNCGASAARNRGIADANQPWVAFLDADDEWLPEKLELQLDAAAHAPDVDLLACDFFRVPRVAHESTFLKADFAAMSRVSRERLTATAFRTGPRHGGFADAAMFMFPSGMLVRREAALEVGGFDPDVRLIEDADFALRLLTQSDIVVVDRPLFRYHIHGGNSSADDVSMMLAFLALARKMENVPSAYPREFVERFRGVAPVRVRAATIDLLRRGDTRQARKLLRTDGWKLDRGRWLLTAASHMPEWLLRSAVRLWRRVR